jgi:predicted  nucleic acid-binding Zn ribbon protein
MEVDRLFQVVEEEDQKMVAMLDEMDYESLVVEREYSVVVNEKDLVVVIILKRKMR